MSSKLLKKENSIATIEFTVSQEEFEKAVNKAYLKVKNSINVQGFRKGKAPKHIIEKKYGKSIFYDEAMNFAVQEVYPTAVKELDLDVIDSPKVNIEKFEEGQDLVFTAEISVMPEVELGEYRGVEVEKVEIKVTDEDVDNQIKQIQEKNARLVEITDRNVQNGDVLTIDYAGFIGDEQFEGGTAENQSLEIGTNSFIPGFEEQLIGKAKDEEVEINVTFPEEYHTENLKGKEAIFKVKIHEIKSKELPEIDDEFAKDVSEFDTLEELKADTKNTLEKSAKDQEKIANENNIITKVVKNAKIDIPQVMIDKEVEFLGRNYEQQFRAQGFMGKEYDDLIKNFVDQYKESAKGQAEFNVRAELVLDAIIAKENIKATEEELKVEAQKVATAYNTMEDRLEDVIENLLETNNTYFEDSVKRRKVMDLIVENAKLVDKVEKEEPEETEKTEETEEK